MDAAQVVDGDAVLGCGERERLVESVDVAQDSAGRLVVDLDTASRCCFGSVTQIRG